MFKLTMVIVMAISLNCFGKQNPIVVMTTNFGNIEIELNQKKSPITVKNFLNYVDKKFYDGVIFHRVINNFMIQGGGFDVNMQQKTPMAPIKNEANNGLKNLVGTIAMARTPAPHSASSQFFINVKDNPFLDYRDENNYGYAVFGSVVKGMPVVNKIKQVKTGTKNGHRDVPVSPVIIKSVRLKN